MLFRLYTERKPNLADLASKRFEGFTILPAVGTWKGVSEDSAVIEVIGTHDDEANILRLAEDIKRENSQEAVYLVKLATSEVLL